MAVVLVTAVKTWEGDAVDEPPRPGLQFDGTTLLAADIPIGSRYTVRQSGEEARWDGAKWVPIGSPLVNAIEQLTTEVHLQADKVLLTGIRYGSGSEQIEVTSQTPLPVVAQGLKNPGGVVPTKPFTPIGIVTGAAYADLDAIGTHAVEVGVPASGVIQSAIYFDLDDEGLQVDLWLYNAAPTPQTDNSAFALNDVDLLNVIDVIQFTGFRDAANGQVSLQNGLGIAYNVPSGVIYAQLQARAALNIAAANLPVFRLEILAD